MSKKWFKQIKKDDFGKLPKRVACSWVMPLLYIVRTASVIFFVIDLIVSMCCGADLRFLLLSVLFLSIAFYCSFSFIFTDVFKDARDHGLGCITNTQMISVLVIFLIAGIVLLAMSVII